MARVLAKEKLLQKAKNRGGYLTFEELSSYTEAANMSLDAMEENL